MKETVIIMVNVINNPGLLGDMIAMNRLQYVYVLEDIRVKTAVVCSTSISISPLK